MTDICYSQNVEPILNEAFQIVLYYQHTKRLAIPKGTFGTVAMEPLVLQAKV